MQKIKRDMGGTYRRGNEKRMIKQNETKGVSGAIKIFIVKKNSTEIKESDSESLSSLND